MIRLIQENKNTPEHFNKNFVDRSKRNPDSQDMRRWKRLIKYYKGGTILDIGCLDSQILMMAESKYPAANKWGMDTSVEAIREMSEKYRKTHFVYGDAYKTKFSDNSFEYVVMGEVLEHLDRPADAIKEAFRILKRGGVLAISVPLEEAREPGACDLEYHVWSFDFNDIKQLLEPYGKVKISRIGSEYFPVYKYHFPNILAWCWKR